MTETDDNLMDPAQRLRDAPRCSARAKSTGARCRCPAVRGWSVCRLHGAGGGAPSGPRHPNYRHGMRTKEAAAFRAAVSKICREGAAALRGIV